MIKLSPTKQVIRWLESGKTLTQRQANIGINIGIRLASIIERLRKGNSKRKPMFIINTGIRGEYAKYMKLGAGMFLTFMFKGYRFQILSYWYIYDDHANINDANIIWEASNGIDTYTLKSHEENFGSREMVKKELLKVINF